MLPHAFSHQDTGYEVSFRRIDSQWFAALCRSGSPVSCSIKPFTAEQIGSFSDEAVRAGYIALAEWLVKQGNSPELADASALEGRSRSAPVIQERLAPSLGGEAQRLIGRELQNLYEDVLTEPLPVNLLARLGADHAHQHRIAPGLSAA